MKISQILSSVLLVLLASTSAYAADVVSDKESKAKADATEEQIKKAKIVNIQLDELTKQGAKYAYLQLAQKNRMSPFAVGVQENGAVVMLEVPKTETQATLADKVLTLRQMLKLAADGGKFVGGALFVQAKVPHQGIQVDGVAIELEHITGLSIIRFSPYSVDFKSQKIKFNEPVEQNKPVVFFKDAKKKFNKA